MLIILVYHKILNSADDSFTDPLQISVSEKRFNEHLSFINREFVLIDLEKGLNTKIVQSPTIYVAITFDDGYKYSLQLADSILYANKAKATAFICPIHCDNPEIFWWDRFADMYIKKYETENQRKKIWRLHQKLIRGRYDDAARKMTVLHPDISDTHRCDITSSWDDLSELSKEVFTFACHGLKHDWFPSMTANELERDLIAAKQMIIENGINAQSILAYPYGYRECVLMTHVSEVIASHFKWGMIAEPGLVVTKDIKNRYFIPRNHVGNWSGENLVNRIHKIANPFISKSQQ